MIGIAEDLLDNNFGETLGLIGAGGQDKISGILNFLPFGVQHPLASSSPAILLFLLPFGRGPLQLLGFLVAVGAIWEAN